MGYIRDIEDMPNQYQYSLEFYKRYYRPFFFFQAEDGIRDCSNNCPYKVRRFNFLQFADYATGSLKLLRNPNVTVRTRGIMEKCTYCVQRIRAAEIESQKRLAGELGTIEDKRAAGRISAAQAEKETAVVRAAARIPDSSALEGGL